MNDTDRDIDFEANYNEHNSSSVQWALFNEKRFARYFNRFEKQYEYDNKIESDKKEER